MKTKKRDKNKKCWKTGKQWEGKKDEQEEI